MVVRQKINSPIIFLKKPKAPFLGVGISFLLFAYVAWIVLTPRIYDYKEGKLVYDELYLLSSFSFLLFFIPLVIFYIQILVERNAICENGFYQGGLLSDWSNFKSYTWSQGDIYADPDVQPFLNKNILVSLTIEPKRTLFGRRIQLIIPFDQKAVIDNLLSTKFRVEIGNPQ
jgi:hypothetical protein